MEVCLVKPTNVFRLISLIGVYQKGEHLENKQIADLVTYTRGKTAKVYSDSDFEVCVDGEIITGKNFEVEILHKKIKFGIPN